MASYNPNTLPKNENLSRFAYCAEISNGKMFIRKGKMIAYYGELRFEAIGKDMLDLLAANAFNAPLAVQDFIVVEGKGLLLIGDDALDISCFDLEEGTMTVKSKHLLGFSGGLACQDSILPGYLCVVGTGKVLTSSLGPAHFLELPCRVDEQALLGWVDCPTPSYRYDYQHVLSYVSLAGALTGITLSSEEKQVDFTGQGAVLVQSSEIDDAKGILHELFLRLPLLGQGELTQLNAKVEEQVKKLGLTQNISLI
jgi:uncharacterized protein (AIM24 family)